MTPEILARCTGATIEHAALYAAPLSAGMAFYGIDTPKRQAAFLAQLGHESEGLRFAIEIWGPTEAQSGYEGRVDLGNVNPGDGSKYRGHGLIQTTGRTNHRLATQRLRARFDDVPDFEASPKLLAEPQWAALSACDYWDMKSLNALADLGDFKTITRRINGGLNGYADRERRWKTAKEVLNA